MDVVLFCYAANIEELLLKYVNKTVRQHTIQEAELAQRDSVSATHVFLGSLTDRALH